MIREVKINPFSKRKLLKINDEIPENITTIGAQSKWQKGYTGKGVVIAVIDTGCETQHLDLKNRIVEGYNFTNELNGNISNVEDLNGHGTHVAGVIAGSINNTGIVGVAPKANLLILKALDRFGRGTIDSLIEAVNFAVDWRGLGGEKVRIISLSLGIEKPDAELLKAITRARNNNICVVAASGNYGDGDFSTNEYFYPADYKEVISVGALQSNNKLASFTNTNEYVDIYAPGEGIYSTYIEDGFTSLSGTSMAVPHVSGSLALLIEEYEYIYGKTISERFAFELLMYHTSKINVSGNHFVNILSLNKHDFEIQEMIKKNRELLLKCFCEARRSQSFFTKCIDDNNSSQDRELLIDIVKDAANISEKIRLYCEKG